MSRYLLFFLVVFFATSLVILYLFGEAPYAELTASYVWFDILYSLVCTPLLLVLSFKLPIFQKKIVLILLFCFLFFGLEIIMYLVKHEISIIKIINDTRSMTFFDMTLYSSFVISYGALGLISFRLLK
jgi:hypothetical protein